jgi:CheY-like chemotaxis protein
MDIKMPRLNGLRAAQQIKKINRNIPIVLQSAFIQSFNVKRCKSSNIDDYIAKPIDQEKLIYMLDKHLQQ